MIPHYLIVVKKPPLAGTGKVNKRLLSQLRPDDLLSGTPAWKECANGKEDSVSSDIAPLAQPLATIFAELLNKPAEEFSIHDDSFFSGGHSITTSTANPAGSGRPYVGDRHGSRRGIARSAV